MKKKKFVKGIISSLSLYALVGMQVLFVPASAPAVVIYDNGTLPSGANANNGTAAPAGTQWSEDQNPFGSTIEANTLAGVSCSVTATLFRCADDFNVPVGQTWTINQVIVFAYQTGFAGATSPITAATLRIWRGRPGDAGSTIVFGDTTTNRLAASTDSLNWRIFSSVVGVGANPPTVPATNRRVWQNNITVAPAAVLTPGNYWIDWNTAIGTAAHFAPTNTVRGTRQTPFVNARQSTTGGTTWVNVTDAGQAPTGAPVPPVLAQDFPFKLDGAVSIAGGAPAVPASRSGDYDGDNKTDFAVVRSADGSSQATWWIQNSGGSQTVVPFGTGVGFVTGDKATPADFDGDGKTDIAVWRPAPALVASFFILQSSNNTVRVEQFGQLADDPTIVDDYDGDGKADPAVYRVGAPSTFYYRGSLSNPGGAVTFVPWGTIGDTALPGDYDGDGNADFRIFRNVGGNAEHWLRLSTGAISTANYGLFTDKFVTGDYDADAKTDIAAVRVNGASYDWYILLSATNVIWGEKYAVSATDYLVPGDYDGDNKTDLVVWRSGQAGDQTFFFLKNTFASPSKAEWGQSAGANTPPDYPAATWNVK